MRPKHTHPALLTIAPGSVFRPMRIILDRNGAMLILDGVPQVREPQNTYLRVESVSGPVASCKFISALRVNTKNTPELGASCDNPTFKTNPSTPGHPTES